MTVIDEADLPPRRRAWLGIVLLVLLAFVAGSIAMGYMLTHWDVAARYLQGSEPEAAQVSTAVAPVHPAAPVTVLAPPSNIALDAVDDRVADLEARIGAIDARARAASSNADRAEALLVVFAARRAIDRGVALGYLEALLRERFGASQPQAVATVISGARQPVTLDELRASLAAVAPQLSGTDPREDWWTQIRRELASLIVIRRSDIPSSAPSDRVARALVQVDAGHVDRALVEIARLPARPTAAAWIQSARRYVGAHQALDTLETAALLAPRAAPLAASAPSPDL